MKRIHWQSAILGGGALGSVFSHDLTGVIAGAVVVPVLLLSALRLFRRRRVETECQAPAGRAIYDV